MAIVGSAVVVVRAEVVKFEEDVNQAFSRMQTAAGRAGSVFGNMFGANASRGLSKFQRESLATYKRINELIERSYYFQAALYQLGAAIGAVVSGLFAFGAQLGSTLPTLIVFPSVLTAFAQAAVALRLALGGIGRAMQQMSNNAKNSADKLKELRKAAQSAKDNLTRATWRLRDAEDALARAAQNARERIQQLGFDAEDAALSQERASIALQEARENLQRVQDLPPNSRARREAELAFKEADLNYRRAVDRNKDLQKEQNEVTANGTKSVDQQVADSEEVLGAKKNLLEAEMAYTKAVAENAEAQEKLRKGQKGIFDDGGGGRDPLADLTEGQKKFAEFLVGLKPKIKELKEAAGKELFTPLTEAIQNLVDKFFPTLIPVLEKTGGALGIAAKDFSNAITSKDNLVDFEKVASTNVDTISKFGKVAGNLYDILLSLLAAADPLIRRFTDWVVALTDGWKESANLAQESGKLTSIFKGAGDAAAQLGDIIGNIMSAFMTMGRAASGPGSGGQMIFDALEGATEKFKTLTKTMEGDGSLEEYFRGAAGNFIKIATIFTKIAKFLLKMGSGEGAGSFLDSISRSVDILGEAFLKLDDTGPAFGRFIEQFATFIAFVTESGSIKIFFNILTGAFSVLNKFLSNSLVERIFLLMAGVHGARLAFTRIYKVFMIVNRYIVGMFTSMSMFVSKLKFYAFAVKYYWQTSAVGARLAAAATAVWSKVTKIATAVSNALKASFLTNPVFLFIAGIVALVAAIVVMYKKFEWFRNAVHAVWDAIKAAGSAVWSAIKAAFDFVWNAIKTAIDLYWNYYIKPVFTAMGAVFSFIWNAIKVAFDLVWTAITTSISFVWNSIIKPIFEAFGAVFSFVWGAIKTAFTLVWDIITNGISFYWNNVIKPIFEAFGTVFSFVWDGIKAAFTLVWDIIRNAISFYWNRVIKPIFELFGTVFSKVWDGIKSAFSSVWDFITGAISKAKDIFGGLGDTIKGAFKTAFNFVADAWNKSIGKIGFKAPSWLGGWEFSVPDIPRLAEGGVIPATRGGMMAIVGEGGRPERVEPLDPDGLSRRDRAIIATLSGNGPSITLNVHPSPGMDEVELANLVSRQLAFHMRKGVL